MIIYGTRSTHLKSAQPRYLKCENCGSDGTIILNVFQQYVHIFWIPTLPIRKLGAAQCTNCNQVTEEKKMPLETKKSYYSLRNETKPPFWHFSGLFVIALLIVYASVSNADKEAQTIKYIQSPQKGDVYDYQTEKDSYTTIRVEEVMKDSLVVSFNKMEVNKEAGIYKIVGQENYPSEKYTIPKKRIAELYDKKKIRNVRR